MEEENRSALQSTFSLIFSKRFGPFLACSFLSNIGTWIQLVAEPWLLLSLSGSSFLLGLDSFMMNGPILLLIFLGGVLADKRDRRNVILLFQSVQMLCPLILVILILMGSLRPWMIVALSLVVGITDALSMPSFQSIVPLIVKPKEISRAIALNSADFNLARIMGPALGGWMMSKYGPIGCFSVNVLSYLPFIATAFLVLPSRRLPAAPLAEKSMALQAPQAAHSILQDKSLRATLASVFLMSFFCSPILAFSSIIISSVLHTGVSDFGNSMAAFGIGGLLGAIFLLFIDEKIELKKICAGSAVLYGLSLTAVGIIHSPAPFFVLMGISGALMAIGSTAANSILQKTAGQENLGRASSFFMLSMRGGMALGNLLAGVLISTLGVVQFFVISGAIGAALQMANYIFWTMRKPATRLEAVQP